MADDETLPWDERDVQNKLLELCNNVVESITTPHNAFIGLLDLVVRFFYVSQKIPHLDGC